MLEKSGRLTWAVSALFYATPCMLLTFFNLGSATTSEFTSEVIKNL